MKVNGKSISEAMREFESNAKKLNEAKSKAITKKQVKVGDIVKVTETERGEYYFTVVEISKLGGFYLYYSDAKGKPVSKSSSDVAHSNSIFSTSLVKIGSKKFKTGKIKGDEYTITGIPHIDMQMMSLGKIHQIFINNATPSVKAVYDDNENKNKHAENCEYVADFLAYLSKGGKSGEFGDGLKADEVKAIINDITGASENVYDVIKKHKDEAIVDRLENIKTKLIMARKEAEAILSEL